ncbi:MAG: hypothetical protein AB1564_04185 [Chloroflexota bacterium]
MNRKIIVFASILLVTLACGLGTPTAPPTPLDTGAIVAATIQALTAQALTAAPPLPTEAPPTAAPTAEPLPFVLPEALGTGAKIEHIPEVSGADLPPWVIFPAHTRYILQGYPLEDMFFDPQILIYPADGLTRLNEGAGTQIIQLTALLNSPGTALPEHMPFIPIFNAGQVFYAHALRIQVPNGAGFRYLTQYGQAPHPINNQELFYTFQGLTGDGRYYVAAILPVNAPFLVADADPEAALPEGGIPFDWTNFDTMTAYLDSITIKINTTDHNTFAPALPLLDTLIQSIQIANP